MALFENQPNDDPQNYLETLVGEGKKYATAEDLAKGYANLNPFAESLKRENSELREDLNSRETVAEQLRLLNKTREENRVREDNTNQPAQPQPNEVASFDEQQLGDLVKKTLNEQEQIRRAEQNTKEVTEKLLSVYGTEQKANEAIVKRANDLNVSIEFLQSIAVQSPKAFFSQLGLSDNQFQNPRPSRSDVNPTTFGENRDSGTKPNTYKWYQELRRSNPSLYHSPKMQLQMHKHAQEFGETFYAA